MRAYKWYSDYPTNLNATFSGTGFFNGGDLPYGLVVELHSPPSGAAFNWRDSIEYRQPWGHIVNNAFLEGGYGSTLPVEEFLITRPREAFRFHEPTTDSIILEMLAGSFAEIWGLYLPIPFLTVTQMGWHTTGTASTSFEPTFDGTSYAGLTDTGVIPLDDDLVGVRVDVTTLPAELSVQAGTPDHVWDIGWLNWGSPHGFGDREWITGSTYESLRPAVARRDLLGYTLHPGVVATITNLLTNG